MPAVLALLKDSGLPCQDINTLPSIDFLVAAPGQSILGAVGLEQYDDAGLLRSLVVRPESRRTGLGMQLAAAMEERAGKAGVAALYLLTTTAADFFVRRGYRVIQRSDAPAALQSTSEFSSLCPAQAICLYKALT
ncbi:arsenic resistance N-acetyltransferase ArsN2 [Noviherbaspirillum sp.]|uniref:arsenic resistance N-acetyltransferase ArsN2 n=1 Tax=Noviherbaspirillum sp. TaxID=1926288 RepID=UPI002DDCAA54|nr:arsenic resistance N-acetyltransferase ArsN2 [Noviherbaspirillum sp.]